MAMARFLPQTLPYRTKSSRVPLSPLLFTHRHRSGKAQPGQIFEIDLDASSSSSSEDGERNINGNNARKLEEVIQNIIVRRAAPDWLPFRPGSSYWVPPPSQNMRNSPYNGVVEVLGRLSNGGGARMDGQIHSSKNLVELLSRDEAMPAFPSRGWPSASYFNEGISPSFPVIEGEMEIEVKILDGTKYDSLDEDEDKEG